MALTYEDIKGPFLERLARDKRAQALLKKIQEGGGTYAIASDYAVRVGECLAAVLRERAPLLDRSEWDLDDLIPRSLGLDHGIVVNACEQVQMDLYRDAGLGIQYQKPLFDNSRAWGLVAELRDNPQFTNIERSFYDQLVNFSQNVVDESIRANADLMLRSGIESTVIRTPDFKACAWCRAVAGRYDYSEVRDTGNDVWRRHENCRCTIDYFTTRNGAPYHERVNNYRK